jgi:tetratricopeptide (TPR) repeat protein
MDQGDFAKGLSTASEGAGILRAALGEENDLTCTVRLNAARALTQLGRLDQAEREYREILEIRRRTLKPENLHLAVTIEALADVLNRRRQFTEALALAREARDKLSSTLGPDSWRIASNGRVLGAALTGLEQYPEAERILRDSYQSLYTKRGATHRTTLLTATRLASLYEAWGRTAAMKEWQARSQP